MWPSYLMLIESNLMCNKCYLYNNPLTTALVLDGPISTLESELYYNWKIGSKTLLFL